MSKRSGTISRAVKTAALAATLAAGTVNRTVEATVPETGEKIAVKFSDINGKQLKSYARLMRARYDSAQTTDDNRRHWAAADNLSAAAANSPSVRCILRNRSRYEVANNSYAKGMVGTIANHTVGTGPRLQISDKRISKATAKWLAEEFGDWMAEVGFAEKLRTMRKDKCQSGEAFGGLVTNYNLDHPVKLDFRTVEADRIANPQFVMTDPRRNVDGIVLDIYDNPSAYQVLRNHPGETVVFGPAEFDTVDVARMGHWFTADRSGQYRGVPETTPSLPLYSQLRRFTLAVIAAAETAADVAGVLYSDAPPDGADDVEPLDTIEIEKRMLLTMPKGWKMGQVEAQQPVTTYAEFKREILKEIARCLQMPYNIAAGDSSDYNFASGKLDCGIYITAIWIDRDLCEKSVLFKVFREWYAEARLIPDYFPDDLRAFGARPPRRQWHWDAIDLNDGVKVATARDISSKGGFGNPGRFYQEDGLDPSEELEAEAEFYGVSVEQLKAQNFANRAANPPVQPGNDGATTPPTRSRNGGQRVQPS